MRQLLSIIAMAGVLTSCANINTLSRTTKTPNKGKAIHLDASQRLVVFDADGNYCAESSADAIRSAGFAFSGGDSDTLGNAANAGFSSGSSAATFGIRTQSIQVMRDVILQSCIQAANENIGRTETAKILNKSLDLTSVIVAIEQLTGPVTGAQANLTISGENTALSRASEATSNVQETRENLTRERILQGEAIRSKSRADANVLAIEQMISQNQTAITNISSTPAGTLAARRQSLEDERARLQEQRTRLIGDQTAAMTLLEARNMAVESQVTELEQLSSLQNTAFVSAGASITANSAITAGSIANRLTATNIEKVSANIENIVSNYLNKDYINETCISFLSVESSKLYDGDSFGNLTLEARKKVFDKDQLLSAICLQRLANIVADNSDGKRNIMENNADFNNGIKNLSSSITGDVILQSK